MVAFLSVGGKLYACAKKVAWNGLKLKGDMTNKEHTEQQALGLSFTLFNDSMNGLICEIKHAISKGETSEWKEQLERSLVLMHEIREKANEAMIVIDSYDRQPTAEDKVCEWLSSMCKKICTISNIIYHFVKILPRW